MSDVQPFYIKPELVDRQENVQYKGISLTLKLMEDNSAAAWKELLSFSFLVFTLALELKYMTIYGVSSRANVYK